MNILLSRFSLHVSRFWTMIGPDHCSLFEITCSLVLVFLVFTSRLVFLILFYLCGCHNFFSYLGMRKPGQNWFLQRLIYIFFPSQPSPNLGVTDSPVVSTSPIHSSHVSSPAECPREDQSTQGMKVYINVDVGIKKSDEDETVKKNGKGLRIHIMTRHGSKRPKVRSQLYFAESKENSS